MNLQLSVHNEMVRCKLIFIASIEILYIYKFRMKQNRLSQILWRLMNKNRRGILFDEIWPNFAEEIF